MSWVKFHEEICSGGKRGWPRATRFVLMELSLKARRGRGAIDLPLGMNDVDGVHDLLGGSRREIQEALRILSSGGDPVLVLEGSEGARRLVIPSWSRWNSIEPDKSSTERVRRHRATVVKRDETIVSSNGNDKETVGERLSNCRGTLSREEENREDKNRGDGETRARAPEPSGSEPHGDVLGLEVAVDAQPPDPLQLLPTEPPGPKAPSPARLVFEAYVAGWREQRRRGAAPVLNPKREKLIAARLRDGFGPEALAAAARGVWRDSWLVDKGLATLELALRDAGQVEKFTRIAESPPPKRDQRGHPMQSGGPDFAPEDA
jgi:hypothetical protein